MEFFINIIYWLNKHKFLAIGISGSFFTILAIINRSDKKKLKWLSFLSIILFIYAIINMIWGNEFTNYFIYKYGQQGTGTVVNVKETNSVYNDENVMAYEVILITKDNKNIETEFESWDFNIYPKPEGAYSYPQPGFEFSVRYLKSNPNAFIILSNGSSPYTIQNECKKALENLNKAKLKFNASASNNAYKNEYLNALKNYINTDCEKNKSILDFYTKEMEKLEQQ